MTSPRKKLKSNTFQLFVFFIETRLSASLEGLNSSLVQSTGELFWHQLVQKSGLKAVMGFERFARTWSLFFELL